MVNYRMLGVDPAKEYDEAVLFATHPAPPGTFVAYAHKDGTSSRTPVVLWGVLQDGLPVPITLSGVWDGVSNRNSFVLHPDGSCSAFEKEWSSLDQAVAEMALLED
jgi:hypothetical protein